MALRPALSNGLPFSSVQSGMMFKTRETLSSNPWQEDMGNVCSYFLQSNRRAEKQRIGAALGTSLNALGFQMKIGQVFVIFFRFFSRKNTAGERM